MNATSIPTPPPPQIEDQEEEEEVEDEDDNDSFMDEEDIKIEQDNERLQLLLKEDDLVSPPKEVTPQRTEEENGFLYGTAKLLETPFEIVSDKSKKDITLKPIIVQGVELPWHYYSGIYTEIRFAYDWKIYRNMYRR
jgi:hypothetical protein